MCQCRAPRSPNFTRTHSLHLPTRLSEGPLVLAPPRGGHQACLPRWLSLTWGGGHRPRLLGLPGAMLLRGVSHWKAWPAPSDSSGSALRLDNLFHFSAPGACPANVTQECLQTDSKDRRNLTAMATRGAKRGRGDQARHGEREERGNGQKPRTPRPHSWRPPSRGLPGSLGKSWFPDGPGAGRAQRHAWAQGPQQDGRDGPVVESWCRESVPESGREPGGRARRWSPRRAERGELHTAQRASKATLNSFSLLVLFFVWLGVFFDSLL